MYAACFISYRWCTAYWLSYQQPHGANELLQSWPQQLKMIMYVRVYVRYPAWQVSFASYAYIQTSMWHEITCASTINCWLLLKSFWLAFGRCWVWILAKVQIMVRFSMASSLPPWKCQDNSLKQVMTTFILILSNSSKPIHRISYTAELLSALINKLQIYAYGLF
jgi:hypothetical protein